jgi:molecular chaperone GrpE
MTDETKIEESLEEIERTDTVDEVVYDDESELGGAEIVKRLREKLKVAVEEKQTYLNNWQKDKAEFLNARRRDEESKIEFLKFAKQGVIEDILPVLDSFDMAFMQSSEGVPKEWKAGMEGIYNQLVGILNKHDVKAFGAKGDVFDPNLHQSIGMMKSENKDDEGKIADVLQKGYMLGGKVIRPAFVHVFEI